MAILWANIVQPVIFLTSWFLGDEVDLSPSLCLQTAPNIQALVACFDTFTVPHAHYNAMTYDLAQPVGTQRTDWRTVIQSLLSVDGDCSAIPIPLSLQGLYAIEPFQQHCVLYETASRCGTYFKGWGFMVVPARRVSVSRNVHISAPHPGYDLGTVEQAASIFSATGSKSLLVTGRTRTAFLENSDCVAPVRSSQDYYKTDPAHNNDEPFFDASIAIQNWEYQHHGGCPSSSCGFMQFHGKGPSTCSSVDIFLSSGLGNSTASRRWYTDDTDRPLKRLQQNLQEYFPRWNVSLPSDSSCPLTATKNVVGRHLNGIPLRSVCSRAATPATATGEFLHAEQAMLSRQPHHYEAWARAVRDTFDVACAEGMVLDAESKMCVIAPTSASRSDLIVIGDMETRSWAGALMEPHSWKGIWYYFMSYLTVLQYL